MKRRKYFGMVLVFMVVVLLAIGCAKEITPTPPAAPTPPTAPPVSPTPTGPQIIPGVKMPDTLRWKGMSSPGSGYDIVTRPALNNIAKVFPGISLQHLPGGTKAGFDRVEANECEIGTVYIGDGPFAWFGQRDYTKPYKHLRAFYQYAPINTVYLVVLKDSKIYGLKDLQGKRVHLGVGGWTTTRFSLPASLALHGITEESIKAAGGFTYIGAMDAALDMLSAGKLDAVSIATVNPSGLVSQVNETMGIRILPMTDKESMVWCLAAPGYYPVKLPSGTYKGQETWPDPNPTIHAYTGLMLIRDTVPDDVAYNLLCAIFGDKGAAYNEIHPALKDVDIVANAYYPDYNPLPLHPGAERYFKESGFKIAPSWVEKWPTWEMCEKEVNDLVVQTIKTGFPIKYLK